MPVVVYLIGWSPEWLFLVALVVTVERGLHEYFNISRPAGSKGFQVLGYLAAAAVCCAQVAELRWPAPWVSIVLTLAVLAALGFGFGWTVDFKQYLAATASTVLGVLYIGFFLSFLIPLRFSDPSAGWRILFFLFLVTWATDILAFFVGRAMGRRALAPRISPKKTVEGAMGGLAGGVLVGWGFAHWFWQTADSKTAILLAALVSLAGQAGDIAESALKRGADLKDSSGLLPGHGGLFDRIDSLLFGAPALWLALSLKDIWR